MKNFSFLFPGIFAIALLFSSCDGTEEVLPDKYLLVNGEKIQLATATVSDYGTNNDITYRNYEIEFTSASDPAYSLEFDLYSTSTTRIEEGTYEYSYSTGIPGTHSNNSVGINIVYDGTGEAISGVRFGDTGATFSGSITISKKNDNYLFDFDLEAVYGDDTYTIAGIYNDVLSEY